MQAVSQEITSSWLQEASQGLELAAVPQRACQTDTLPCLTERPPSYTSWLLVQNLVQEIILLYFSHFCSAVIHLQLILSISSI